MSKIHDIHEVRVWTDVNGVKRFIYSKECKRKECKKEFWVRRSSIDKKQYCRPECYRASSKKSVALTCAVCSTRFVRRLAKAIEPKGVLRFCGRKCKDVSQRVDGPIYQKIVARLTGLIPVGSTSAGLAQR